MPVFAIIAPRDGLAAILHSNGSIESVYDVNGVLVPTYSAIGLHDFETAIVSVRDACEAVRILKQMADMSVCLDMVLMLFDDDISHSTKTRIAIELRSLLFETSVKEYVQDILFARPLPASANVIAATAAATGIEPTSGFIREVVDAQPRVCRVFSAWLMVEKDTLSNQASANCVYAALSTNGVFRRLAVEVTNQANLRSIKGELIVATSRNSSHRIDPRDVEAFLLQFEKLLPAGTDNQSALQQQIGESSLSANRESLPDVQSKFKVAAGLKEVFPSRLRILKIKNLCGPNVWANFPVLEVWVDLEEFEQKPSDLLPGFNERLMNWLPSMIEHRCSEGVRGGFFERLRRGTWLGHILEHTSLELQTLAGTAVGFGRARETSTSGVYRVAIEYQSEALARASVDAGNRLLTAAIYDMDFDVQSEVDKLRVIAEETCLGPSTKSIVDAAVRRGIPWRRMTSGNLIRLGHGVHQKRILAAETSATSAIAESIAQDKELTRQLLSEAGISVPEGGPVSSLEEAIGEAREISSAVVVKPRFGNQGRSVTTNISSPDQIAEAYRAANLESDKGIIVERFVTGDDFRLLVVGSRLVAAAHLTPAHVVGDGASSVDELIRKVNTDPQRGISHGSPLTRLENDVTSVAILAEQGLTLASVLEAGQTAFLRRNADLSTGGTAVDITDEIHPDFAASAIEAAQVIGLDVAGIHIVALDPRRPLDPSNGAIVEVNAAPGLRMHLSPSSGTPRDVGAAIIDLMFAEGETGRIPTVAVTGVNGKTTVTRLIAHMIRCDGRKVGMTCTDGIWIDDRRIDTGDCGGPVSAQTVLAHPQVQVAVLETARGGILRAGLGFDLCDVAVVTNIGEGDHLGLEGIDTLEKLAQVKRTIVDVVKPKGTAVLNAADPFVAPMSEKCPGRSLMFAIAEHHPALFAHRSVGQSVIFVRNGSIVLVEDGAETVIDALTNIPVTMKGHVAFQIENVLAAAAAGWSLGLPLSQIQLGLRTFHPDLKQSPGRFNIVEINNAMVVVDYGHNPSALDALIKAIETLPGNRRSVVYSAPGNRRNCDIERQGEQMGNHFDDVYVYEGHYKRGRADGETIALFQSGLNRGTRAKNICTVEGALVAAETALNNLRPGDLLLLQADTVDETIDFLMDYVSRKNLAPIRMTAATLPTGSSASSNPMLKAETLAVHSETVIVQLK